MEKVKLIAHRGLYNGPDKALENQPWQIKDALSKGYDAEIDLWYIDGKFILGHDGPNFEVKEDFIRQPGLWIHAKNLEALHWLSTTRLTYFWHQNDDCVITSNGYIWTYPEKPLTDRSIRLMPEWKDRKFTDIKEQKCWGICSDYVEIISTMLTSDQT